MRIGIFTETWTPYISGLVTSEVMLKNALEKLGHTVYVVTANLQEFKYDYNEKEKILKIPGVPTGIYDSRFTSVYPVKAVKMIKKWNLDVIHSQTEFSIGTFARVLGKQLDIPIVHTYHTMYEDYVHYITKGHFDGASKKLVEYLTKFYCDKTIQELIVPTRKTYDLFKEKYKYDRNVHIIPTGIEIDRFYKEKISLDKVNKLKTQLNITVNDTILLFVGRIASEKNIEFLLDAHSQIVKKHKNAKLLIVGDGPDLEEYKKLSFKYKIQNNVIFTGKVPWEDVPLYYSISDIFVTASYTETQGLTVVEAMAASLPVIALNDDAFKNTVVDGLTGELFNKKSEYISKMNNLIGNQDKIRNMGEQGRINSEAYSSKYFAERVLDVYTLAIKKKTSDKGFKNKLRNIFKVKP